MSAASKTRRRRDDAICTSHFMSHINNDIQTTHRDRLYLLGKQAVGLIELRAPLAPQEHPVACLAAAQDLLLPAPLPPAQGGQ